MNLTASTEPVARSCFPRSAALGVGLLHERKSLAAMAIRRSFHSPSLTTQTTLNGAMQQESKFSVAGWRTQFSVCASRDPERKNQSFETAD